MRPVRWRTRPVRWRCGADAPQPAAATSRIRESRRPWRRPRQQSWPREPLGPKGFLYAGKGCCARVHHQSYSHLSWRISLSTVGTRRALVGLIAVVRPTCRFAGGGDVARLGLRSNPQLLQPLDCAFVEAYEALVRIGVNSGLDLMLAVSTALSFSAP